MTIELSKHIIDAIADAVAKKIQIPKTAHWVKKFQGFPPEPTMVCSECDFDIDFYLHTVFIIEGSALMKSTRFDKIKYCPNCGAKMAESEEV